MSSSILSTVDSTSPVAVIGLGCRYPGARQPAELWENILARRQQFRRMPDERLPWTDYGDDEPRTPDRTYGRRAAVLDGFVFDWAKRRIPRASFEATDVVHWLALETALQAVEDAGYEATSLPRGRMGVVVGNTLTGEVTRSNTLRLRWPFVQRALRESAQALGLPAQELEALSRAMEARFKSVFPPVNEDTLAGGLSNTIAGRVCNFLDLHGGGYTVDGACASSLLAVTTAAERIASGAWDCALAGGVDVSLDPFELVGFAKAGALTRTSMRVYDRRGDGFIPGEGAGFVLLKRLDAARRDGDRVYALLSGWGVASDGKGGITAPKGEGQARALRSAYSKAGWATSTLDFVEGHGTGTAVGDREELSGIALALGEVPDRRCGVTSFKSLVGHTKAAAGVGGLLKAVMAVNRRVIPPTVGCEEPHPLFEGAARGLYPVLEGARHPADATLRAGISGMGFGGINCHVVVESADAPAAELVTSLDERSLLASHQGTELFLLAAGSAQALDASVQRLANHAHGASQAELVDLAAHCATEVSGSVRAAILADSVQSLRERLEELRSLLRTPLPSKPASFSGGRLWVGQTHAAPRVGFLFPGQGSQQLQMARRLVERFPWARALVAEADAWLAEVGAEPVSAFLLQPLDRCTVADRETLAKALADTQRAQPAICLASLLWLQWLERCGVRPSAVAGHSLGELTAFHAAGVFDARTLLQLAAVRGKAMAAPGSAAGAMASLACSRSVAEALLLESQGEVTVANVNSPNQLVVAGPRAAVEQVVARAQASSVNAKLLPVSNAFHSRLVAPAAEVLRTSAVLPERAQAPRVALFSGMGGARVEQAEALREHFARQVLAEVDFVSVAQRMAAQADVLLEVGPGRVLSGLVGQILGDGGLSCLPVESRPGRDADLNGAMAVLFVSGAALTPAALFASRSVKPFVPASELEFIENPCERPFTAPASEAPLHREQTQGASVPLASVLGDYFTRNGQFLADVIAAHAKSVGSAAPVPLPQPTVVTPAPAEVPGPSMPVASSTASDVQRTLTELAVQRTGFSPEAVTASSRLLDDLNLDSIKAGELVAQAAQRFGVAGKIDPSTLANATLSEIASAIGKLRGGPGNEDLRRVLQELAAQRTGFSPEAVTRSSRLLDDLNLDSIKAGELVSQAAQRFGVAGKIDPSTLANATLEEIASAFERARGNVAPPAPGTPESLPNWVRSFALEPVASPLEATSHGALAGPLWLVSETADHHHGPALGSATRLHTFESLGGGDRAAHLIALLPRASGDGDRLAALSRAVGRLSAVARAACRKLTVVQFSAGLESGSATSFAASLHLERPELEVRVLECAETVEPTVLAGWIAQEHNTAERFSAASYSAEGQRFTQQPRPVFAAGAAARARPLDANDVVLVTGGARGITAECALALARTCRARFALVGSSPAAGAGTAAGEISRTLERFAREGLTARYYRCDVTQGAEVRALVAQVQQELGAISGVIHGAGVNVPRRADQVPADEALREVSPKLAGALHLFDALESAPPRLFVGLSSIIGVTGMPGNAWYAFSNELLARQVQDFAARHAQTQTVCLAYSVWDEVGMGARMGSTEKLARMGIGAIPPDAGIQHFLDWVTHVPPSPQVVITARLGGLDTWRPARAAQPRQARFLEELRYLEPGVMAVVRATLSVEKDPYLRDHEFQGSLLFPTVMGLEAMAQVAALVTGVRDFDAVTLEDIRLERPIVVSASEPRPIELRAEVLAPGRVRVDIAPGPGDFARAHFSATFVLGNAPLARSTWSIPEQGSRLALEPSRDLYGPLLFQGPRFQRLTGVYALHGSSEGRGGCTYSVSAAGAELETEGAFLLGDAFFRDTLLQSVQLIIPQDLSLPVHIARLQWRRSEPKAERFARTVLERREGQEYVASVEAVDEHGQLLQRLEGYRLRIMRTRPELPTAAQLAQGLAASEERLQPPAQHLRAAVVDANVPDEQRLQQELARRAASLGKVAPLPALERVALHPLPRDERRLLEEPIALRAVRRVPRGEELP